jgi:stress-induced morphogen
MYSIEIESEQFKGVRTPKQHQMVTAVIEVRQSTVTLPRLMCMCIYQRTTATEYLLPFLLQEEIKQWHGFTLKTGVPK